MSPRALGQKQGLVPGDPRGKDSGTASLAGVSPPKPRRRAGQRSPPDAGQEEDALSSRPDSPAGRQQLLRGHRENVIGGTASEHGFALAAVTVVLREMGSIAFTPGAFPVAPTEAEGLQFLYVVK